MAKKGKYTSQWPRPMVSADTAVFTFFGQRPHLLLINRKNNPFKGQWALPGGFLELDEEIEHTAARELSEETDLTGINLQQIHTFAKCRRDPRGRVVTIVFMGIIENPPANLKAGDDAAKAQWFDIEKLPEKLAFDHEKVTAYAIKKLKRKKIYRLNSKNA